MKIILAILISMLFGLISCKKDCTMSETAICKETPPTNELCLAAFERWFYNKDKNKCEQIGYSGCSQKGFETEEECEECECECE